jgi:hypothetical protein
MTLLIGIVTFIFSLFSTTIMSYIAMATPIGPWVDPILALVALVLFSKISNPQARDRAIIYTVVGGSLGGILAIAFGSSYPTLYFLDKPLFMSWMEQPAHFAVLMSVAGLAASLYGFFIANVLQDHFLEQQKLPFPIGQMVFNMLNSAQGSLRKAWELFAGFCSTLVLCGLQGGIGMFRAIIPSSLKLLHASTMFGIKIPAIELRFDTLPMLWAIGFITGSTIAIPLAIGALSKIFIVDPLNGCLFPNLCSWDFSIAFCSGLVTSSSLLGFASLPNLIKNFLHSGVQSISQSGNKKFLSFNGTHWILIPFGISFILFCILFNVSVLMAIYLLIGTFMTTYIMTSIAGKIGLAQLGRFATFVMVPAMFLFGIHPVQLTIIATFVEITGGVATDILFGRRLAQLSEAPRKQISIWQIFGLVVSCCSVGIIFWILINHFGLGSGVLFAQRAQARALLINLQSFNLYVLGLGALYGLLLKKLNLNPMLVFGGLLMPLNYSLGLILGGFSTYLVSDTARWEPFWSGVFAANSIWEVLKALF